MKNLNESLLEVIRHTSVELPHDIIEALEAQRQLEKTGSQARYALDIISENIALAKKKSQPLCQDTGSILFYITIRRRPCRTKTQTKKYASG